VPDTVEFENQALRHYFTTYDNAEARGIDAGAAGPGWRRTGIAFRPGGASPVCRFYGTPGIGPNSHFYTADPAECELVKTLRGWTYEGIAFHVTVPELFGGCRIDQRPVYRFYNNRAAQNDSNHRYTTDLVVYATLIARGPWKGEGIVMCAQP
jgi:serine protease